MKALAIETTGQTGSFAVVEGLGGAGAPDPEVLAGVDRDIMGRHVEKGVLLVSEVLDMAGLRPGQLDGVAVSLGPGSFTGLRVGLGIAKGLCFGAGLPLVGVPTLDCLARPLADREGLIVPARDARRGELYCCIYTSGGPVPERVTGYMSLAPEALVGEIEAARGPEGGRVTLVGDGVARYGSVFERMSVGIDLAPEELWNVSASVVGAIGLELMSAGLTLEIDAAEPIYVRPSEAERKRMGLERGNAG